MPRADALPAIIESRERNVAHCWQDKRVLRLLRNGLNLDNNEYKLYRNTYIALCEIDSDFSEEKGGECQLNAIIQTCATYSGLDRETVSWVMKVLAKMQLIDYGQHILEKGRFGGSYLKLFIYNDNINYAELAAPYLEYKRRQLAARKQESGGGKDRLRTRPLTVTSAGGRVRLCKNDIDKSISTESENLNTKDTAAPVGASFETQKQISSVQPINSQLPFPSKAERMVKANQKRVTENASKRERVQHIPNLAVEQKVGQVYSHWLTEYPKHRDGNPWDENRSKDRHTIRTALKKRPPDKLIAQIDFFFSPACPAWITSRTLSTCLSQSVTDAFNGRNQTKQKTENTGTRFTRGGGIKAEPGKYAHLGTTCRG